MSTGALPAINSPTTAGAVHHGPTRVGFARFWAHRHVFLALTDLAILGASILVAYLIRFKAGLALWSAEAPDPIPYIRSGLLLSATWMYVVWRAGAYERGLRGVASPVIRVRLLLKAGLIAVTAVMAFGFLNREFLLSRQVYLTSAIAAVISMTISRSAFSRLDRVLAERGYVAAQIAIVGTNRVALEFADSVERESHGSLRVMGLISRRPNHDSATNRQILGHVDEIESIYKRIHFDKLVLATPEAGESFKERRGGTVISLLNFCEQNGVALYMVPDSFEIAVAPSEVASFSGTPLVRLQDTALHPVYEVVKRLMDMVFSCAILLIGLPLWLAIAVGLKFTSSGPILFSQLRAGHNGRPFRMYKFRSMSVDAESRLGQLVDLDALQEPVFKIKNDPRVTAFGRWLRRSGLDEIPQLINVLRGEMSLVGPRPEEIALVHKYDQWQRRRLKAKPGITGYQQIKNRGGSSLTERIGYDLVYLKHQSLGLDLYIMLHTPLVLLRGSGVSH